MVSPGSSEPFSAVKNQSLRATSVPLSQNAKQVDKPAVTGFPDVVKTEPIRDQQQVQQHASFEMARSVNFAESSAEVSDAAPEQPVAEVNALPVHSERMTQFLDQVKSAQEKGYGAVDAHRLQGVFEKIGIPMADNVAIVASQMTEVFAADASSQGQTPDELEARLQANYVRIMALNVDKEGLSGLSPEQGQEESALLKDNESLRRQLADRLAQRVLETQASGGPLDARRSGFEGAMAAITQLDQGSGLADAMQRIATGQDLEGIQLNTQGGSNVALNLLQRIQPSLQQDGSLGFEGRQTRQTRQEMEKVANWSREILEGRVPHFSPQDVQLLSELGIGVHGGKLVNAGDGQELSRAVIQNLGHLATCTGIALSSTGGMTPANVAMRDFLTKLTVAQDALNRVATKREELTLATENVEEITEEVIQKAQLLDTTTLQLTAKQQEVDALADDLALTDEEAATLLADDVQNPASKTTQPMGASSGSGGVEEEAVDGSRRGRRKHERSPLWERPDPLGLRTKALERMGLRVSGSTGEPRQFFVDNREVSERDFKQALHTRRQAGFKRLLNLSQDVHTLGSQLQQQHQDLAASTERLERERRQLKTIEQQYQQTLADANTATTDLTKFQQSADWQLLPPQFQGAATPLVDNIRTQMAQENAVAPKILARSQAADQRAEVAINQAVSSLRQASIALSRTDELDARLDAMDAARKAHHQAAGAAIRVDVDRLVQEADRLQAELELMSAPHYIGVEQLFESWRASLAEVQHIFQRLANEQMMVDAQDALTTRVNTDRMREGLSYHQKQLEQLDQLQQVRMAEVLAHSSEWVQQTLPTLLKAS